jgi:transposase-like protein
MTADGWIILTISTAWLVLPAALAIFRGRRWRLWFIIGIFIPILTILILLLLPTIDKNRDKSAQNATKGQKSKTKITKGTDKMKNSYTEEFKKEVALAAKEPGSTLASIGEQFGVSPTLVRNWKIKFSEEVMADSSQEEKLRISVEVVESWLQKSTVEGTIHSDGDLYVSIETTSETITDEPAKLYISGTQKLAAGEKSETSEISEQLTTNETNWLRSGFLNGVGRENAQFTYNLNCELYDCAERVVVPLKLNKGKVSDCPITAGQIGISELKFVFEDGDFRAEGTITGPNGFIYAAQVLTNEPEAGYVPSVNKTPDDENSAEMYEFLWDVKKGDTVFVVLCAFERLDGKLSCGFTGEAQIEEPISYDDDDDDDGNDFGGPEVEDVETNDGDIGLFEFQIKRGLVDEDEIEDEDVQKLVDELRQLCDDENFEEAASLLISNLSFEFGPGDLDDNPEVFFASTDFIEFNCSSENTSVKIEYDDCLIVTISELAEYLPESGAWANASASPGWGYTGSDGDNVWFLGIKE